MPPVFNVSPSFGIVPQRAWLGGDNGQNGYFPDDDTWWRRLLASPPVGPKEGSCIRGAVFHEDAMHPTQLNVVELHGLVLDVDEFGNQPVALEVAREVIARRLHGVRYIAWTTYNSTPTAPRYRVILPLARAVPRRQYRHLWSLVNAELGYVVGEGQWNADRLGYLPRLPNESARLGYRAWIHDGPLLDPYVRFGQLEETPDQIFLADHAAEHARAVDTSQFVSEADALARARSYMRDAHLGVKQGSRHLKLFEKACQLWWDFYLDGPSVLAVLTEINSRFEQPKQLSDVMKEVEAGFAWTRGPTARPQRTEAGHRRMRPPHVTAQAIEEWGQRMKRRPATAELGKAAIALARRDPYAEPEAVLDVTRQIARAAGERWPKSDATQIAALFQHSLAIMRAQSPATWPRRFGQTMAEALDVVRTLVTQRQHEKRAEDDHAADAEKRELAERISIGTGGARTAPFNEDELAIFASQQGCTVAELKRRLVVNFGSSCFFFRGEHGYSPPVEQNASVYASTALAAFEPWGVDVYATNDDDGRKLKTVDEILDTYGVVADNVTYSFIEQRSRFDASTLSLVQACCPIRRGLRAEHVPEVEQYLSLVGVDREVLLDWLAFLPRLDQPARILYLVGPPDTGKSFLANCLARLWSTTGPTKAPDLFRDFNEALLKCPLVFADEQLPRELRGARGTERLREEMQQLKRSMLAKYRRQSVVEGALRWILAGNNHSLIETQDTLTRDDVEGIVHRVDLVEVSAAAGVYLRGLGYERTRRWLEEDLVAKHVLHLQETRELGQLGRFGPAKRARSVFSSWTAANEVDSQLRFSGASGQLAEWLYLDVVRMNSQHVRWGQNGTDTLYALVAVDDVLTQWEAIFGIGARSPGRPVLLKALKALRTALGRDPSDRKRFHAISVDRLEEWARLNDVDLEELAGKVRTAAQARLVRFSKEADSVASRDA